MSARVIKIGAKSIEIAILGIAVSGLIFAVVSLILGNFGSSASFEI